MGVGALPTTSPASPAGASVFGVSISSDQMAAHLELTRNDLDEAASPTIEEALAALAAAKVTFGINIALVVAALETHGRAVLVAEGKPSFEGVDGYVEYAPNVVVVGGRPHVGNDGKISLFDLDLVHNVDEGALLATCVPPTVGEHGVTVLGKPHLARAGRPVRVRAGPGTVNTDGLQIFASTAGHAAVVGEVITVSPIFYIRGDVGPATGNIDFVGSVSIAGNVDAGYRVQAGGDIDIQGGLAAGDIEAGGNVNIRYGIQGHDGRGSVVAKGSIVAKFIEFAIVRAGGSVFASDGIVRSTVEAGGKVEVMGRRGSIVGGRVQAREAVSARDLGSPHGIPTEIVVGTDPALQAEAQESRAQAIVLVRQLEQVQQKVVQLQVQDREQHLSPQGREQLEKFHEVYKTLLDQRSVLKARQQVLVEQLQGLRLAIVVALGTCHPEVRISIGNATCPVKEAWKSIRFQRNQQTGDVEYLSLTEAETT